MSTAELHGAFTVATVVAQQHRCDLHYDISLVYIAVAERLLECIKTTGQGATA
jgi:hypothetical protein